MKKIVMFVVVGIVLGYGIIVLHDLYFRSLLLTLHPMRSLL